MNQLEKHLASELSRVARQAPAFRGLERADTPCRRSPHMLLPIAAAAVAAAMVVGGAYVATRNGSDSMLPQSDGVAAAGPGTPDPASTATPIDDLERADLLRGVGHEVFRYQDLPGFGNVAMDTDTLTLTIYWQGDPPPEVATLAGPQPNGVQVNIFKATYSAAELAVAGRRLFAAGENGGIPMSTVRPTADLSGLIAEVSSQYIPEDAAPLVQQLEDVADVPVALEVGNPPVSAPANLESSHTSP